MPYEAGRRGAATPAAALGIRSTSLEGYHEFYFPRSRPHLAQIQPARTVRASLRGKPVAADAGAAVPDRLCARRFRRCPLRSRTLLRERRPRVGNDLAPFCEQCGARRHLLAARPGLAALPRRGTWRPVRDLGSGPRAGRHLPSGHRHNTHGVTRGLLADLGRSARNR